MSMWLLCFMPNLQYLVNCLGFSFLNISFTERKCDHIISMHYLRCLSNFYNVSPVLQAFFAFCELHVCCKLFHLNHVCAVSYHLSSS